MNVRKNKVFVKLTCHLITRTQSTQSNSVGLFSSELLLLLVLWFGLVTLPMRQRVAVSFGRTRNAVSHLRAKQFTCCGGPAWQYMQTEQLLCWSGMTDTEHIVQHLVQTKLVLLLKHCSLSDEYFWCGSM